MTQDTPPPTIWNTFRAFVAERHARAQQAAAARQAAICVCGHHQNDHTDSGPCTIEQPHPIAWETREVATEDVPTFIGADIIGRSRDGDGNETAVLRVATRWRAATCRCTAYEQRTTAPLPPL